MSSKENLRPLKILVFSMGLLLVGGTILLFALVIKKVNQEGKPQACEKKTLELAGRGQLVETQLEGGKLRVMLVAAPGEYEIITLDACRGQELGSLRIKADAPKR